MQVDLAVSTLSDMTKKNRAAVALGRRGGKARAKALTKARRSEIARLGGAASWKNRKKKIT
jgi:general stress protein YciG